jgi:MFS family permease
MLIAQFLAAFNDQAIHASAMFFAINRGTLNEAQAISLMPILFYAPWALFCTFAGYLADRYSKYYSLVFWKFAEVGITLLALLGFWIGTHGSAAGPWLVLSTVFLMGTHSAFFVPAKYGAMPEILTGRMLSRGNGVLESLSFLAVILGTVCGGVLSTVFRGQEYYLGLVLCGLAVIGAAASLLIGRMPPANPKRSFPAYVYGPIIKNVRALLTSRPLAFATVGIAFFTFVVAFMRATVYMFGESQVPRWSESQTSELVCLVALGIGLGSPLVGYLSGGKVELGLVPIGAAGMILATVAAGLFLGTTATLIVCIIAIGFSTGFYIVPLFTLLQHRAPKTSKGDFIATSNLINVTGAIVASLVFYLIDLGATYYELVPKLEQTPRPPGVLLEDPEYRDGRPYRLVILRDYATNRVPAGGTRTLTEGEESEDRYAVVDVDDGDLIDTFRDPPKKGDRVEESVYRLGKVRYHRIRREGQPQRPVYDKSRLPTGLFLSAAALTLFTLIILRLQLPDLFLRTRLWAHFVWNTRLEVTGMEHCPGDGAAVLAMSCRNSEECLQVLSASERTTRLLLLQGAKEPELTGLARLLAVKLGLGAVREGSRPAQPESNGANGHPDDWSEACARTDAALSRGEVVALPLHYAPAAEWLDRIMPLDSTLRVVPVLLVALTPDSGRRIVHVVAGEAIQGARVSAVLGALGNLEETVKARLAAGEPIAETEGH